MGRGEPTTWNTPDQMESILYARLPDDIVVIRVCGKGNHTNSVALRKVFDMTSDSRHCGRYIFDLAKCTTMDSTFMGVMASIALSQKRLDRSHCVAVNMAPRTLDQLETLGLHYVIEMRRGATEPTVEIETQAARFNAVDSPPMNKLNRIVMMIEAHEKLIDVDGGNEVKFRGVLQNLRQSLEHYLEEESS